MSERPERALERGTLANPDAVLQIRTSRVDPSGMRAIDILPAGGIAIRILPDRGFDLGQAWFSGIPLAWVSRTGEAPPLDDPAGMDWGDAFGGGLVVTCGLRNVGMPSEGHGLHGTFSHIAAADVTVERVLTGEGHVRARATMVDDRDTPTLTVHREILTYAGRGRVEVTDRTVNAGPEPVEAPLLYHCNFGHPLWSGNAVLEADVTTTVPRDEASEAGLDHWRTPPDPAVGPEWVFEHDPVPVDGTASARIVQPDLGVEVVVSWDTDQLPILNQWIDANPGMSVLGLEPANCGTRGRSAERRRLGTLPAIEPGRDRMTHIAIEARHL